MKRIIFVFFAAVLSTTICSAAMSNSKVRKETRFLTDKMAYELSLNTEQYNDVYEINYDFIAGIRHLMDDVMRGEEWALNRYYDYLDVRNDDLRWVLSSRQYGRFMGADYFYRPVYVSGRDWSFRIYVTYVNHNHFYFPRPHHYRTYCGGHYRTHHNDVSFYRGRYKQPVYNGTYRIRDDRSYTTTRRSDFGSVNLRPNSSTRPTESISNRRRSSSSDSSRESINSSPSRSSREHNNGRRSTGNSTRVSSEDNNRRGASSTTRSSSNNSSHNRSSRGSENSSRR